MYTVNGQLLFPTINGLPALYNIVAGGTWQSSSWTIGAVTLGGAVNLNAQTLKSNDDFADSTLHVIQGARSSVNTLTFSTYKASRGTYAAPSAVQLNDYVGGFNTLGYKTDAWSAATAGILVVATENWTNTQTGTKIEFYTTPTSGTTLNTAMTLSGDGLLWADVGVNVDDYYQVAGTQVVGARQIDARINDTPNSGDATTDGIIAALQACVQTHGLMTAA